MDSEETVIKLNKEVRDAITKKSPRVGLWKEPATIYIGPAGENLVRNSAVCTKICHAFGYGGYGALMRSKNLKAIAVKSRGRFPTVDAPETVKVLWRKVNGPRIITLQKAFLPMGGPDLTWEPIKDDVNPPRYYEPLPSGPFKGKTTDKERVDLRMKAYFDTLGWDERGIPKKETLEKLDLGFLEKSMAKYR